MTDPHSPPFSRFTPTRDLAAAADRPIVETADPRELREIAEAFELVSLDALSVEARIERAPGDLWRLSGAISARVVQSCVVTLEPVAATVDEPFERLYDPAAAPVDPMEVEVAPDEDDPPEPLGAGVDVGAVALETLALSLDPYPRAKGAVFEGRAAAPPGAEPITPEALKPFAGLAALKKSLENKG
ncbi:MAG: DUF177 domain-containing protein [Pseudomonadota bacterium]